MPVTNDIVATYRRPRAVMRRLLDMGQREDRLLAFLMAGCGVVFVSQWPVAVRQAHFEGHELNALLGAALMAWIFIAPLMMYGIAALSHVIARIVGGQGTFYAARLALFWSFLAATPLMLLNGLVGGFIGPGLELRLVGIVWLGVFLWFWGATLSVAEKGNA